MNKQTALSILLRHTKVFTPEIKQKIEVSIHTFSEEDLDTLGTFLALEKKKGMKEYQVLQEKIMKLLEVHRE